MASMTMRVKLAKKIRLRDPSGVLMKMDVEYSVPRNQFWLKREQAGDVVELVKKSAKIADKKPDSKKKNGGK